MAQHFLLSSAARTINLRTIMQMSDAEAFAMLKAIRFAENGGEPYCPRCGIVKVYTLADAPVRWKCSACRKKFSLTSGTALHSRKLSLRDILAVIGLWVGGVKGVAALRMARDMGINPKSIFVFLHKLRECMGAVVASGPELVGEAEIDGAYFGSSIRQSNRIADRRQQRRDDSKRQVVVVARERGIGRTMAWVVGRESDAVPMIRQTIASGTEVHADESGAWNILHASYLMKRVNHSQEFKNEASGGCTNAAESYFARLRRAEFGIHHRISGHLLEAYARECAWREDTRRVANGTQWRWVASAALAQGKSERWTNYWHREARA